MHVHRKNQYMPLDIKLDDEALFTSMGLVDLQLYGYGKVYG